MFARGIKMNKKLQQQIAFLGELEKLKTVTRMNKTLDSGRNENSAEHSWHSTLMVLILKEYAPAEIDVLRVVTMLLIHDIVEIDTGDVFLYNEERRKSVEAEELVAAKRIFGMLPSPQDQEMLALWEEFEAEESADAKFAKAIDRFQPLINHPITREKGDKIESVTKSKIIEKKRFLKEYSPQLWEAALAAINRCLEKEIIADC